MTIRASSAGLGMSVWLAVGLLANPTTAAAEIPKAGVVLTKSNAARYDEVLGASLRWLVDHGATMRVGPHHRFEYPPAFAAATAKYAGEASLSPDGSRVLHHVAGLPFLRVAPDDPQAGAKHIWNFDAAIAVDDLDLQQLECDTGSLEKNGEPAHLEKHFLVDHFRRLYFEGRTVVDPKPTMPNRDAVKYKEGVRPLIEPFELRGTGFVTNRYLDAAKQDDSWLYLPQLRRVRRLSSFQRAEPLFAQDIDLDSFSGFSANPAFFDWRYIGEKTLLSSSHGADAKVQWQQAAGGILPDDAWEPRKVWVVEGKPKVPDYPASRRVIFLDQENYRIPVSEMYAVDGQLWKAWVGNARRPAKDARKGTGREAVLASSATMVDMKAGHATWCTMPGLHFPEEQGWYVNVGEATGTVEGWFDLSPVFWR